MDHLHGPKRQRRSLPRIGNNPRKGASDDGVCRLRVLCPRPVRKCIPKSQALYNAVRLERSSTRRLSCIFARLAILDGVPPGRGQQVLSTMA